MSAVGKLSYNQLVEKIITCKHSSDPNLVTEGDGGALFFFVIACEGQLSISCSSCLSLLNAQITDAPSQPLAVLIEQMQSGFKEGFSSQL